jgi:hypothetical protein
MNKNDFEPLIAAHDFVSSRLIFFFNTDEFADVSFVLNEFEVFGIFITTIAFIQDNEKVSEAADLLEEFHKTIVERIVARIVESQPDEVSEEQEDALEEKILAIFQERLRLYFNVFQNQEEKGQEVFTALAETFVDNAIQNNKDALVCHRFSPFAYELFLETVILIQKSFELKNDALQQNN